MTTIDAISTEQGEQIELFYLLDDMPRIDGKRRTHSWTKPVTFVDDPHDTVSKICECRKCGATWERVWTKGQKLLHEFQRGGDSFGSKMMECFD